MVASDERMIPMHVQDSFGHCDIGKRSAQRVRKLP
jgi:hypothetical protein